MQLLTEQDIDISAFAGVRERIYIHDARQFGQQRLADAANGIGACVYLADASIRPNRSTGRHQHRGIDIVTVVLNGELLHRGTLGDAHLLRQGDAMIQRAGARGFSHDEINPGDRFNRFLQLWFEPEDGRDAPTFDYLTTSTDGLTTLYCTTPHSTTQHTGTRVQCLVTHKPLSLQLQGPVQMFVISGEVSVQESTQPPQTLSGGLITAQSPGIEVAQDATILIIDIIINNAGVA